MIEKDNLTKYLLFLGCLPIYGEIPVQERYERDYPGDEATLKDNENIAVTDCFIPITAFPNQQLCLY